MIKNQDQYDATKKQIDKFQRTLEDLNDSEKTDGYHPKLIKAKKDALLSEVEKLQQSIDEYDRLNR